MISTVGVDGDIVCYRCAATAQGQPEEIAIYRVEDLMNRIMLETNAQTHKVFLSGSNNFRYDIFPEYKLHRRDKPKPEHLERCRQYLVEHWGASISELGEADDSLGIFQKDLESVIASIDKDLLQIPGHHYNFVRQEFIFVSPFDALRNFYSQVITGDGADGIPGYDGKIRNSVPKFMQRLLEPLKEFTEELDMYNYVYQIYSSADTTETLKRNAKVLYIMRKEGDYWEPPKQVDTNQDSKHSLQLN